ncbi:Reverse transcriptase zinc-binding domain [Sesbania bispinosa]|nr:Reverse transcriptase zinc-binding domain [Sesbania bispinosa]
MGMVPSANVDCPDKVMWRLTPNGFFSTKSAYHLVIQSPQGPNHKVWKVIWKLKVPHRYKCFLWMVLKGGLNTNFLRYSRKISDTDLCPLCKSNSKQAIHILRDCTKAKEIWNLLKAEDMDANFYNNDITNWIFRNLTNHSCHFGGSPWSSLFIVTLSSLWHYRNGVVFAAKHAHSNGIFHGILGKAAEFNHVLSTNRSSNVSAPPIVSASIKWTYPNYPFIKCNVDASLRDGGMKATCGRLFRNETGTWIRGFVRNIGSASITMSELWGILSALQVAQSL